MRRARREAAHWFEIHGEPEEALRCLAGAGDRDGVARLLTTHGQALLARGSVDAVLEAVDSSRPRFDHRSSSSSPAKGSRSGGTGRRLFAASTGRPAAPSCCRLASRGASACCGT